MEMADMIRIMRMVQAVEATGSDRAKAHAADGLCRAVRRLIEDEAEETARYSELMWILGEEG